MDGMDSALDSAYDALCREFGMKNVIRQENKIHAFTGKSLVSVAAPFSEDYEETLVAFAYLHSGDHIYHFPAEDIADYIDILTEIPILIPSLCKSPEDASYVPFYTNPIWYRGSQDDENLCRTVYELGARAAFASECLEELLHAMPKEGTSASEDEEDS